MVIVCGVASEISSAAMRSTSGCMSCKAPRRSTMQGTVTSFCSTPDETTREPHAVEDGRAASADAEGGGDQAQRRHHYRPPRVSRVSRAHAVVEFPDAALARSMTTTEQIIWAHQVDKERARCSRRYRPRTLTCCPHPTEPHRSPFTRSIRLPAAIAFIRGRSRLPTIILCLPAVPMM